MSNLWTGFLCVTSLAVLTHVALMFIKWPICAVGRRLRLKHWQQLADPKPEASDVQRKRDSLIAFAPDSDQEYRDAGLVTGTFALSLYLHAQVSPDSLYMWATAHLRFGHGLIILVFAFTALLYWLLVDLRYFSIRERDSTHLSDVMREVKLSWFLGVLMLAILYTFALPVAVYSS